MTMKEKKLFERTALSNEDGERVWNLIKDVLNTKAGTSTRVDRLDDVLDFVNELQNKQYIYALNKGIQTGRSRALQEVKENI